MVLMCQHMQSLEILASLEVLEWGGRGNGMLVIVQKGQQDESCHGGVFNVFSLKDYKILVCVILYYNL